MLRLSPVVGVLISNFWDSGGLGVLGAGFSGGLMFCGFVSDVPSLVWLSFFKSSGMDMLLFSRGSACALDPVVVVVGLVRVGLMGELVSVLRLVACCPVVRFLVPRVGVGC